MNTKPSPIESSKPIAGNSPEPTTPISAGETSNIVARRQVPSTQDELNKVPALECTSNSNSVTESLAKLKYIELRKICDRAESDWRKAHLDSRAPTPKDGVGQDLARKQLFESLRGLLSRVSYFRGDGTITLGSRQIEFDIFLSFYSQKDQSQVSRLPQIIDPGDLCYTIAPVFLVDGVPSQQSLSSMSSCGAPLPKIGDSFYFSWTTVADKPVLESLSMVLIPLPGSKGGGLNYMVSDSEKWEVLDGFRWQHSTKAEFEQAQTRYQKIRESITN